MLGINSGIGGLSSGKGKLDWVGFTSIMATEGSAPPRDECDNLETQ